MPDTPETPSNQASRPGILHVHGQQFWHDDLTIRGNRKGLEALRDALNVALAETPVTASDAVAMQKDGEAFCIDVQCVEDNVAETLGHAYHDESLFPPAPGSRTEMRRPENWRRRVFLCGPMVGLKDLNAQAFTQAAEKLEDQGFFVENPSRHGAHDWASSADYLRYDVTRLATCERLYLMPGWSTRPESRFLVLVAQKLSLAIDFDDDAECLDEAQGLDEPDITAADGPMTLSFQLKLWRDVFTLRTIGKVFYNEIDFGALSEKQKMLVKHLSLALSLDPLYLDSLDMDSEGEDVALHQYHALLMRRQCSLQLERSRNSMENR